MRTVRVRIAVAVGPNYWASAGSSTLPEYHHMDAREALRTMEGKNEANAAHIVWVEADVPVPEAVTVEGAVTPASAGRGA